MKTDSLSFLLIFVYFISILGLAFGVPHRVFGQESTPSASVTLSPDRLEKIKLLKERVATKVAELKATTSSASAIGGTVKLVEDDNLVIRSGETDVTVHLTPDVEIFLEGDKETLLKKEDIQHVGILLAFAGTKNEAIFEAKKIYTRPKQDFLIGKVSSIDRPAGTILVGSSAGTTTVDIEKTTRINAYDPKQGIVKSGFSKLIVGSTVHILALPSDEDDRVTALRMLSLFEPQATPSAQPSKEVLENQP